uniref:C2 domain-containing protein n=1 Tax=Paramoeba aestuarina TaxID=180227 RepID=A0A7S4NV85_9EUKA
MEAWGPEGCPYQAPIIGVVRLVIKRGEAINTLSKADPYVVGNFPGTIEKFQTTTKYNTLFPEWNETFEAFTTRRGGSVNWVVYENELNQKGRELGTVKFSWKATPFEWVHFKRAVTFKGQQKGNLFFSLVWLPLLPLSHPLSSRLNYLPGESEVVLFLHIKRCRNLHLLQTIPYSIPKQRIIRRYSVQVLVGTQNDRTKPRPSECPNYSKRMTFFTTRKCLMEEGVRIVVMSNWIKKGQCHLSMEHLSAGELNVPLSSGLMSPRSTTENRETASIEITTALLAIKNQDLEDQGDDKGKGKESANAS